MASNKKGGKADRTHKPTGAHHYAPMKGKVITARATRNVMRETGVNGDFARMIINTPLTQNIKG